MGLTRSEHMARIRGTDTGPEVSLRSHLWSKGLRYRVRPATSGGRPDLVFSGSRVVVFVDGCFWHGCPLHYVTPRTRRSFWAPKLIPNIERDRRHTRQLEEEGWTVIRVWEHEVQAELERVGNEIEDAVRIGGLSHQTRWCVWRVEDTPNHKGHERRYLVDMRHPGRLAVDEGPRFSRRGPKDPSKVTRRWQGTDLDAATGRNWDALA